MAINSEADSHFEYLRTLGFSEDDIAELKQDAEHWAPVYEMSTFMARSWDGVADPNMDSGWLNNTLRMLRDEKVSQDDTRLSFYDESEWEALRTAVEKLCAAGVDESSLLTLVRACQKNALGSLFQYLDGGSGGEQRLFEIKMQDGELHPTRYFTDMEDFFMAYDPINITKNKDTS